MLPPEVNSGRMYSGPGAGPMLAAAAAWDALSFELRSAATGYEATIAELTREWSGPSATAMTTAAAPYLTWLHTTAAQAEQSAAQARAAAGAYASAFATTVPPPVIAANRSQLLTLIATNFFGQNTAAIAATEAHYAQMWAQDATAMYTYAADAATAAVLQPFAAPPQTADPAAAAVSDSALLGALTPFASADPALTSAYQGLAVTLLGSMVVDSFGTFVIDALGTFVIDMGGVAIGAMEAGALPLAALMGWSSPMTAGLGGAASIGALSVPAAWATAVSSALPPAGAVLTAAGTPTGPAIGAIPFAPMAAASLAGGGTAAAARPGPGDGTSRTKPRPPEASRQPELSARPVPSGPITGISAKLRRLAKLRDIGVLTDQKFTERKRRLLDHQSSR